jgi:lactate permease
MTIGLLLFTLLPIVLILCLLVVFKKPADVSGVLGWLAICLVAWLGFQTSFDVLWRSTLAGIIRSFSVSLIVATSLLQMAFMEKTGALRRVIIFIKTIAADNRAVQIMMINIGFGTLMVAVGATPVSLLPPILLAMGYSTYVAIALPAIGYDALCTYALLGAPIVVFVDIANSFLGKGHEITLSQAGGVFFLFLPVVSTLIGLSMLWITGKLQAIKSGWLPTVLTGGVIALVSFFTNRHDNLVVLTGVLCGLAVIVTMAIFLKLTGGKLIDRSRLSDDDRAYEQKYPLWKALVPWTLLIVMVLALNIPKSVFHVLYRQWKFPVLGLTANGAPLDTRFVWNAYTWILVSVVLAIPLMRPSRKQMVDSLKIWWRRAPRPVFSAAIFFAIGEIMNMAGYDIAKKTFVVPSMVKVLAEYSASTFHGAYGGIVAFIGLFGGFITGSEASTIAMFGKYTLTTAKALNLGLVGLITIAAGLAFGGGLASVISPAKLQNAAASIDKLGEENKVIRVAFVFALVLTAVTSLFVLFLVGRQGAA